MLWASNLDSRMSGVHELHLPAPPMPGTARARECGRALRRQLRKSRRLVSARCRRPVPPPAMSKRKAPSGTPNQGITDLLTGGGALGGPRRASPRPLQPLQPRFSPQSWRTTSGTSTGPSTSTTPTGTASPPLPAVRGAAGPRRGWALSPEPRCSAGRRRPSSPGTPARSGAGPKPRSW